MTRKYGGVSGKGYASGGKNERRFTSEDFMFDADQGKAGSVAYRLENKVNNLLAANFIVLKREELSTETGLRKALSFHFDPITDTEMFVVVEQIRSLNQSIEKLDKTIEDHGSKMDGFKNLKSIKESDRKARRLCSRQSAISMTSVLRNSLRLISESSRE